MTDFNHDLDTVPDRSGGLLRRFGTLVQAMLSLSCLGVLAWYDIEIFGELARQFGTYSYSESQGTLDNRDIAKLNDKSRVLNVAYHFEVAGKRHDGTRHRWVTSSGRQDGGFLNRERDRLVIGQPVTVYHRADDPEKAVLFRGLTGRDLMPVLIMAFFNVLGLVALWELASLISGRRSKTRMDLFDDSSVESSNGGWKIQLETSRGWKLKLGLFGALSAFGLLVGYIVLTVACNAWLDSIAFVLSTAGVIVSFSVLMAWATPDGWIVIDRESGLLVFSESVPFCRTSRFEIERIEGVDVERKEYRHRGSTSVGYKVAISCRTSGGESTRFVIFSDKDELVAMRLAGLLSDKLGLNRPSQPIAVITL